MSMHIERSEAGEYSRIRKKFRKMIKHRLTSLCIMKAVM